MAKAFIKQKLLLVIWSLCIALALQAQAPKGINYQAVVRDASGNLVQNSPVNFRFSIHNVTPAGSIIYQQTDTVVTDQMGLITVVLGGGGSIAIGNFGQIDWANGGKFLQVELDATGGNAYVNMGTTQMLSVPYALYAGSAPNSDTTWTHNATGDIYNSNPGNVGINNPTPGTALDVHGYTALGENAPKIKTRKVTGSTSPTPGGVVSVNLGIPDSSILSVSVQVEDPVNGLTAPLTLLTGREYSYSVLSSVFSVANSLTNSSAILSKPYKALIIYEEP